MEAVANGSAAAPARAVRADELSRFTPLPDGGGDESTCKVKGDNVQVSRWEVQRRR